MNNGPDQQTATPLSLAQDTFTEDEDEEDDHKEEQHTVMEEVTDEEVHEIHEPELNTPDEREKFYQEVWFFSTARLTLAHFVIAG